MKGRPMEVVMTNDVWAAALAGDAVAGDGFWSETDRLYQAGWPVDRRRVRKIPLDGQPVCPWLGGLEDVDSRGSVDRPGRSKLLRSLRKAL